MAASSPSKVFLEQLKDAGERLLKPPASTPELLTLLDEVELLSSKVEQAPSEQTYEALLPVMKALIAPDLLRHSEFDVKASVASCISEITRVTAPNEPYDDEQMQEIFELTVAALGKLSLASGRSYTKAVSILHNIAFVRSCLVMLDLEFDELIVEMFQLFLNAIRSDHPPSVFSDMEMIMTLVLEETEEIPLELIIPLLTSVKKGNQSNSPLSWKLGENVLKKCADKLGPYLPPAVQYMGIDVGDFAEIVFSICQDACRSEHMNGPPVSANGPSNSGDSQLKKASQKKGKRKRIAPKEEVPEMANGMENHGEELIGCLIKVWWPLDRRFYEGAISSFDPIEKKHKVLYADGDEEMLDLSTERWVFVSKSNSSEHDQANDVPSSNVLSARKMDSVDASLLPSPSHEVDTDNPLWKYVTVIAKKSDGGGNVTWRCNFCKVIKRGSYTRVRGHLLNSPSAGVRPCEKVTSKDIAVMRRLEDKAKGRKKKCLPSPSDEVDRKSSSGEVDRNSSPSGEVDRKNPSGEVDGKNPSDEVDSNPLWRYVTRLEKRKVGGGNVTWRCNFCNDVKKGSYTRVRGHLLNWLSAGVKPCEKVTHEDIATMQRLENEALARRK